MNLANRTGALLALLFFALSPTVWAQNARLSGTVTDASDGNPLPGANVVLLQNEVMTTGAATDIDGKFTISGLAPGTYAVRVRFIGYQESNLSVTLATGEARTLDVALSQAGFELNTVVITASRREEKALDAPASISVLSAEDVEGHVGTNSVEALRNTTGVDMAQTGIDRREVVLRGFNNAFSGAAYVLTDYRQAAVPSLGVNIYSIMPNLGIDIDRVEVVRGPGSALYGAGVDAGVIHFITKDPFSHPGTTISVSGGERSYFSFAGRQAGVIGDKVGYKITGTYGQADDWTLDPNDAIDKGQIAQDGRTRNNSFWKTNVNGTLEYRPREGVSLIANGGYSALKASVLSGIGTVQADNFGYSYGQLRFRMDNFFAQAYVNKNSAGDSFVYGGSKVVDRGVSINTQAQYDLELAEGREKIIVGADLELTRPDTRGTILGRNENNDDINEYGGYVQSTTAISPKLDLTVAVRGDYNNIVSTFQVSPRAGFVFKPIPNQTFRATYNRAFSSPGVNSLFLDIVAGQIPGTGITIRGRGAGQGFDWERNSAFGAIAGTDLVASSLNPAALGVKTPVGLPLDATYASLYAGIAAIPIPVLTATLQAQGLPVDDATVGQLVFLLDPSRTAVNGFSKGQMGIINLSNPSEQPKIVNDLEDIKPLDQTISQTLEVGYKGLFSNRVLVAIDGYYTHKEDFVGPLSLESPFVFVPTLQTDLTGAIATGIAGNATLAGALGALGLTSEQVAGLMLQLAGSALPDAATPVAIVQAAQNDPGVGQVPELMLSYRNFGKIDYWGIDADVQVLATDELSLFGNISFINDDFFNNRELNETNTSLALALNSPKFKGKFGFDYHSKQGFSFNAAGRYVDGFPVLSGPYVGKVKNYFLLDVGAGYNFDQYAPGLRFDLGVSNIFDNSHHEFIGAPKLGRMGIARLTYTLPGF